MDYQKKSKDDMDERELRMYQASLRQTLIGKRDNCRREQTKLDKEELDIKYLSRQKEQINEELEIRESKIRIVDNDIYHLTSEIEDRKRAKGALEMDIVKLKKQTSDMDYQIKNRSKELEELRYQIREMEQDIKRMEAESRS
jgi:chromosome segregation ATPase